MQTILIILLLVVAVAMIGIVLLQRSEGGALGIGGGPGGFMSARGSANLLTRATAVLAGLFIAICLALAILSGAGLRKERSVMEAAPAGAAESASASEEAGPKAPSVPEAAGELVVIPEEGATENWTPEAPQGAAPPEAPESGATPAVPSVPEAK